MKRRCDGLVLSDPLVERPVGLSLFVTQLTPMSIRFHYTDLIGEICSFLKDPTDARFGMALAASFGPFAGCVLYMHRIQKFTRYPDLGA